MGKSISENFSEFSNATQDYIESTINYHKLDLYKKGAKGAVAISYNLILAFFLLIALLFLSVAASIAIGKALDSVPLGYLIVGVFYLLIMVVLIFTLKRKLETLILRKTSKQFFNTNEDINVTQYEDVQ
ncbi:MAG: phage holin family protein [Nonlabens sp.]